MTATATEARTASPALCAVRADDVRSCRRPLGHDGPHRHPERGEWHNDDPDAKGCGAREIAHHARCTRDPGHDGGHADHKRGFYWQAGS